MKNIVDLPQRLHDGRRFERLQDPERDLGGFFIFIASRQAFF